MHERPQRVERGRLAGVLGGEPPLRVLGDLVGDRDDHVVHQLAAVLEVPVQRRVADARAAGDLVEREDRAVLHEQLARGGDDPLPVAHGVGPRARDAALRLLGRGGHGGLLHGSGALESG